jgi:deazaflavin-dependent oxidoreductase (nitroreductase family)
MTTTDRSVLDNLRYPIRQFNKRILNPAMLAFAGHRLSPYAAVRHVGRRTGREYATPIVVGPAEDGFVIPLPYGENIDWLRNVLAAGGCTIEWQGRPYEVTEPQVVDSSTALATLPVRHKLALSLFGIYKFLSLKTLPTASEAPDTPAERPRRSGNARRRKKP